WRPRRKPEPAPSAERGGRAWVRAVALVGSGAKPSPAKADERAAEKRAAAEKARIAAEQAAAERKAARLAARRAAEADRAAQAARIARERRRLAEAAAAAHPRPRPAARQIAMAESPRRSITGIGFRPQGGGEVIVRSDQPLEYGISGEDNAILLHLPSAGIPLSNNRR